MHLIDIQRVILRYITVTYRDNNQVIWNKKKCPVCMNFNCMPFHPHLKLSFRTQIGLFSALNLKVAKVASQVIEACFCSQLLEMK